MFIVLVCETGVNGMHMSITALSHSSQSAFAALLRGGVFVCDARWTECLSISGTYQTNMHIYMMLVDARLCGASPHVADSSVCIYLCVYIKASGELKTCRFKGCVDRVFVIACV